MIGSNLIIDFVLLMFLYNAVEDLARNNTAKVGVYCVVVAYRELRDRKRSAASNDES